MMAEFVTGAQLYLDQASNLVVRIHLLGTWIILAYVPAHIAIHWAIGGFTQLARIFRPGGIASAAPPFDPMELLVQLNHQIADAKRNQTRSLQRGHKSPQSDPQQVHMHGALTGNRRPRSTPSTVQANPLVVALAAAIVTIGFVLPVERAAQDRLYIRKIATAELPILDGDASDPIWLAVKPLTIWTAFGGNFDGKGETSASGRRNLRIPLTGTVSAASSKPWFHCPCRSAQLATELWRVARIDVLHLSERQRRHEISEVQSWLDAGWTPRCHSNVRARPDAHAQS